MENAKLVLAVSIIVTASMAVAAKPAAEQVTDDTMAGIFADTIYSSVKDPTSLRFLSLGTSDGDAWCAVYSATNSFNARITEQMYYSIRTNRASKSSGDFNRHCAGTLRKDYSEAMNARILAVRKKLGLP